MHIALTTPGFCAPKRRHSGRKLVYKATSTLSRRLTSRAGSPFASGSTPCPCSGNECHTARSRARDAATARYARGRGSGPSSATPKAVRRCQGRVRETDQTAAPRHRRGSCHVRATRPSVHAQTRPTVAWTARRRPAAAYPVVRVRSLCGNQNFTARSTPSTRRLLDGVAMPVPRRSIEPGRPRHRREMMHLTHWLISTQVRQRRPRRAGDTARPGLRAVGLRAERRRPVALRARPPTGPRANRGDPQGMGPSRARRRDGRRARGAARAARGGAGIAAPAEAPRRLARGGVRGRVGMLSWCFVIFWCLRMARAPLPRAARRGHGSARARSRRRRGRRGRRRRGPGSTRTRGPCRSRR
jgi:hypothetical protein